MFDPTQIPQPDDCGFFCHPDIPDDEYLDVKAFCEGNGFETCFVGLEYDATPEAGEIADAYAEGDTSTIGKWAPHHPDGEGWLMVAKYETEGSGPCALFVRRAA